MDTIDTIEALEALYGPPIPAARDKVVSALTPLYSQWISASRFLILSTIGPEGTDASPRGDAGAVVQISDPKTLLLPDWRGNNRLDSLRNLVRDPRISLMFMISGCNNVVRINGRAALTADPSIIGRFMQNGNSPKTVISVTIGEVYFQCAKALMRSALWKAQAPPENLPTAGQFVKELNKSFDADAYDRGYADYAKDRMW